MKLDYQQIENKADELYTEECKQPRLDPTDLEMLSVEIKCFFRALVDEINHQQTK